MEEWDAEEFDFERMYEEELDMMRDTLEGPDPPPAACKSLSLASPDLPPGAGRKRPLEESPLPFMPSPDEAPHRKFPRLQANSTPPSSGLTKSHKLGQQKKLSSQWEDSDTEPSQSEMDRVAENISNPVSIPRTDWSDGKDWYTPPRRENKTTSAAGSAHSYHNPSSIGGGTRDEERRRVWRRAPPGAHVTVTDSDGVRVYLRLRPLTRLLETSRRWDSSRAHLLSVPFAQLRQRVEEQMYQNFINQGRELSDEHSQPLFDSEDPNADLDKENAPDDKAGDENDGGKKQVECHLWVEKYSPKRFTELLSDDGINRTILSWLKLWDEVVFGRAASSNKQKVVKKKDSKPPQPQKAMKTSKARQDELQDPTSFASEEALDDTRRPKLRVALLCGPPGLGKTTLAHIIALHAGYNPVEMNASDDRSPEVFRSTLEAATQMQAVLTAGSKPNCLIIDEIDGAPLPAINVLIEVIKKKDAGKKKKKKSSGVLSRPIICICNDQYAPSLRQLRQLSLVLSFPPTATTRLAARLYEISRQEHMKAPTSVLVALCEKTTNDIRACLNTLQFIRRQQKSLTLATVQSVSVGQKDAQRSLFSLWKTVFQLPSTKKHTRHTLNKGPLRISGTVDLLQDTQQDESTKMTRFNNMLTTAAATGEYERVANGLFENYLSMKYKDPNLESMTHVQDWFLFHDMLLNKVHSKQEYQLYGFLPFLSVVSHYLFSSPSSPHVRYPYSHFEAQQQLQRYKQLILTLLTEVSPAVRHTLDVGSLSTYILPLLLETISPNLRPVNMQLYTAREKQQLADLVDTMISYNLSYHQERTPEGSYTYTLDPNVEELCRFSGLPQRKQLSYSIKQLLAREIDLEKMRRSERFVSKGNGTQDKVNSTPERKKPTSSKPVSSYHLPKPVSPAIIKEKRPVDFFGRPLSGSKKGGLGQSSKKLKTLSSSQPLWFRFNEGYSNAVRRPVKISDLL